MKKVIALFTVICLMTTLCGCALLKDIVDSTGREKPKTFEFDGVSIELTNQFFRMDFLSEDYDFVVGTDDITVMGVKAVVEDNEEIPVIDYADFYRTAIAYKNPTEITEIDDVPTFQCVMDDEDGEDTRVAVMFYKGTDCFWVIFFAADTDDFSENYNDICKYAKTVKCQ